MSKRVQIELDRDGGDQWLCRLLSRIQRQKQRFIVGSASFRMTALTSFSAACKAPPFPY